MNVLTFVRSSDDRLLDRVVAWRPPRWVRVLVIAATRMGDGWLWFATAALLAACGSFALRVLAACAVSAAIANTLLVCVKRRVRRPRPLERARPAGFDIGPLAWLPSNRFSFPSGHALNAFAIGSVIALAYPWAAIPVLAAAACVAASRVALGLHWLSDVLAGSLVGILIGGAVFAVLLG